MTGPVEIQSSFIKPTEASRGISYQMSAQEAAQQSLAMDMVKKTRESTQHAQAMEKTDNESVRDSTDQESENAEQKSSSPKRKEEERKPLEDEFRGHFLDIRL